MSVYQCYTHAGYPQQFGNVISIGGTGDNELFLGWQNDARPYYRNKVDVSNDWTSWKPLAFISDINYYAPTKTGGGASGTWGINISGNAATATTANALNGIINREPATNNHAIIPGASARDYCEFHEFGAVWNFIKTSNEGSTTVASIRSDGFHGNVVGNADTATNADSATTAGNVSGKIYYSADSPSVATDKLFTVKQAHVGEDNVPNNGLVIQTGPKGAAYNGKLYITDNGSDGVWIGGVASGKEVGWTRLVENKGTWNISITGNAASATNADKLDGYHASDIINKISAANTGGIVAASLTENGYVKFANGLILQWGNASGEKEEADNSTTFPIAFPSTCFVVLLTPKRYIASSRLHSQSKTGFTWTVKSGLISWAALGM